MKKRYELQVKNCRWERSLFDKKESEQTLKSKISLAEYLNALTSSLKYRVVQKLGRKVIKVVYPEGK